MSVWVIFQLLTRSPSLLDSFSQVHWPRYHTYNHNNVALLIFNGLSHLLPRTTAKHFLGIFVPCGNSAPWLTAIVYSMNEDTLHLLRIKEHSWGGLRFLCLLVFQGSRQVTAPCLFHSFISFWLYCISISTHNILEETGHMSRLLFIFPCAVVYITRGSSALWLVAAG